MARGSAVAEVSPDGKTLTCRSADGKVTWSKGRPSVSDWYALTACGVDSDIEAGRFQYAGSEISGVIIAVFTTGGGLDFNLMYSTVTGDLLNISEAR